MKRLRKKLVSAKNTRSLQQEKSDLPRINRMEICSFTAASAGISWSPTGMAGYANPSVFRRLWPELSMWTNEISLTLVVD